MPNLIVLNSGHVLARWAEARRIDGNQVYETVPKDTTPSDVANRFRMNNTPGSFFPLPSTGQSKWPQAYIMHNGNGNWYFHAEADIHASWTQTNIPAGGMALLPEQALFFRHNVEGHVPALGNRGAEGMAATAGRIFRRLAWEQSMLEVTWISADLSFECAQTANVPSPFPAHKECYLRASWGDSYITALWHPTGYQGPAIPGVTPPNGPCWEIHRHLMQSNGTFNDPPIEFNTSTSLPHISEMAFAQFNPGGNAVAECLVSNTPEPRGSYDWKDENCLKETLGNQSGADRDCEETWNGFVKVKVHAPVANGPN